MCSRSLVNLFGGKRPYDVNASDYDAIQEPEDHIRVGPDVRTRANASDLQRFDGDPRCLTLARMRYALVAAPLWTELQSRRPTTRYAFTNIPITLRSRKPTLPVDQIALINLGGAGSTVTLYQGRDMVEFPDAQFSLRSDTGNAIPAINTSIAADGRSVSGTFPPLTSFGIRATAEPAAPKTGSVDTEGRPVVSGIYRLALVMSDPRKECGEHKEDAKTDGFCSHDYPVRFFDGSTPQASSPFGLDASAGAIVANPLSGTGRLVVAISAASADASTAKLRLSVEGAQIASARRRDGAALQLGPGGWRTDATGEVVLELENLVPNSIVKVSLKDGTVPAGTISRSVVAAAPQGSQ